MRKLWASLGMAILMSCPAYGARCGSFAPVEMNQKEIKRNFEPNIFLVSSGGEPGTAFLIDPEHGYLVTASHVIKASIDDPSIPIYLSHKDFGKQTIVAVSTGKNTHDVALIQLVHPELLHSLGHLDISFALPDRLDALVILGYGSPTGPSALTDQPGSVYELGDETFNVTMNAWGGDSGAPALDVYGRVIGVGIAYVPNAVIAQFVPMFVVRDLFEHLDLTARTVEVDEKIRDKTMTPEEFSATLTPNNNRLTNLEWFSWSGYVESQPPDQYSAIGTFIPCPLEEAFRERGLSDALDKLKNFRKTDAKVSTAIDIADKASRVSQWQTAIALYSNAVGELPVHHDNPLRYRALSGMAGAQFELGDLTSAAAGYKSALAVAPSSNDKALAYQQLATISARQGHKELAIQYIGQAIRKSDQPEKVLTGTAWTSDPLTSEAVFRSGPKSSGQGKNFSPWYSVCSSPTPPGKSIVSVQFELIGDRKCSAWSVCEAVPVTADGVACYRFQLQGHSEGLIPTSAISEGVLKIVYSSDSKTVIGSKP